MKRPTLTLEQGHRIMHAKSCTGRTVNPKCKRALAHLYRMLNALKLRAGIRP